MQNGKTILVIEDNPAYAKIVCKRLESNGYKAVIAGDGLEGYALARKLRPDLILLDLILPGLDGHKVCRLIKFDRNLRNTPVAMFTSRDTEEDESTARAARADAYMLKLVSAGTMLEVIKNLLEKAEQFEVEHLRFKGEDLSILKPKCGSAEPVAA
jgi:DNA-binding response OmpR family regulator